MTTDIGRAMNENDSLRDELARLRADLVELKDELWFAENSDQYIGEASVEIARLRAEAADHNALWARKYAELADELAKARAENEALRAALRFYCDEWLVTAEDSTPFEPTDALWEDKGDRARKTLGLQAVNTDDDFRHETWGVGLDDPA
jgi:predicted DNA-binding ribbon-helix-helix protein